MKRILIMIALAVFVCVSTAGAVELNLAAMTDEELVEMPDLIKAEIARREREAKEAAALVGVQTDGEIIYQNDKQRLAKIIFSTEEQLRSRLHKIKLTSENWSEYLGDYYYPYEYVNTNNFGEVTRSDEYRAVGFGFREGHVGVCADVGMKFTGKAAFSYETEWNEEEKTSVVVSEEWKQSDEEYVFDLYTDGKQDVHLEDYECTAAVGTLYVLEVAPEASRWLLDPSENVGWIQLYVGDKQYGDSDTLKSLYERLNP